MAIIIIETSHYTNDTLSSSIIEHYQLLSNGIELRISFKNGGIHSRYSLFVAPEVFCVDLKGNVVVFSLTGCKTVDSDSLLFIVNSICEFFVA